MPTQCCQRDTHKTGQGDDFSSIKAKTSAPHKGLLTFSKATEKDGDTNVLDKKKAPSNWIT